MQIVWCDIDRDDLVCVNADWPCPAYLGMSLRAAELRRRAGVYRPMRIGCVASADDPLTMIMLSVSLEAGT